MKYGKITALLLMLLLITGILFGCGSAYKSDDVPFDNEMAQEVTEAPAGSLLEDGELPPAEGQSPDQKLIRTVSIHAETEDLDKFLTGLNEKIVELNGYVEQQEIYNGSAYAGRRYRNLHMTIRIPAENLETFAGQVEEAANVVSKNTSTEDVTLSYVDTESRIEALKTEQTRLMELLKQAESMEDLLEIEGRLTDVRYELESFESQLRVLENKVSYSTVELSAEEVVEFTPVEEETVWQRISHGFVDSLKGLGNGIVECFVFIMANLPYLLVIGGIIALIVFLIIHGRKKRRNRKNQKPESEK